MASVERSFFGLLGTMVALAWALHEVVYLHEMARDAAEPRSPLPPDLP